MLIQKKSSIFYLSNKINVYYKYDSEDISSILVIPCFVSTHGISWPEEKSITFMKNRFVAAKRIPGPKIRFYCFLWNKDL